MEYVLVYTYWRDGGSQFNERSGIKQFEANDDREAISKVPEIVANIDEDELLRSDEMVSYKLMRWKKLVVIHYHNYRS